MAAKRKMFSLRIVKKDAYNYSENFSKNVKVVSKS